MKLMIIFLLFGLIICNADAGGYSNNNRLMRKYVRVKYEVTFPNGEKPNPRPIYLWLKEPTTFAIDALVKANTLNKECFKSDWNLQIYGAFVTKVCGVSGAGNKFWAFYVNDQLANVGVSCFKLKHKDVMRLTYQSFSPHSK